MSYQITTTVLGLALAGAILYLVRRDQMHGPYAAWWLSVAGITVVLGFFPRVIDWAAAWVGISNPPNLIFALAIGMMLIKLLRVDIEASRKERRIRRLAQKLAILAEENARLRAPGAGKPGKQAGSR